MSCASAGSVHLGIVSMAHRAKGGCVLKKSGSSVWYWISGSLTLRAAPAMASATLVTSRCRPRVKVRQEFLAEAQLSDEVQHAMVA